MEKNLMVTRQKRETRTTTLSIEMGLPVTSALSFPDNLAMKSISLILCVLFNFQLQAQNISGPCNTIILNNGVEIVASLGSLEEDFLIYRNCPDNSLVSYHLPIKFIYTIRDATGQPDMVIKELAQLQAEQTKKDKLIPVRSWLFKRKSDQKVIAIPDGNAVRVKYFDTANKARTINGIWKDLTADALVLETNRDGAFTVPKDKIIKIKKLRKDLRATRAAVGIAVGLTVTILLGFAAAAAFIGILSAILGGSGGSSGGGGLIVALLLVVGFIAFVFGSGPKTIADPFDGNEWELIHPTELPTQESTIQP